jgi:hypothetical protein
VFGVDVCGDAAHCLRLRDDLQRERRFARAFRSVDFDDATARESADADCCIETDAIEPLPNFL